MRSRSNYYMSAGLAVALGATISIVDGSPAFAATPGTTGFTSTGSIGISLTVLDEVKISNLVDIPLTFSGSDVSGTSSACVYRHGDTGLYDVTGMGSGASNTYSLTDGTNTVTYDVEFDDGSGLSTLVSGVATASENATNVNDDCATGGNNALIQVSIAAESVPVLPASTYTGTLTLLLAPH